MAAELTKRAGRMTRLRAAKLWAVGPETVDVVIQTAAEVVLGFCGAAKPISAASPDYGGPTLSGGAGGGTNDTYRVDASY